MECIRKMVNLIECSRPCPHIIIEDFFKPYQLKTILKEIKSLPNKLTIGDMRGKIKLDTKNNFNCWLDDAYPKRDSKILNAFKKQFWSKTMKHKLRHTDNRIFHTYEYTNEDHTLLSVYRDGGFYHTHNDINPGMLLTTVVMLCNTPQQFTGGDFRLDSKLIRFENNRAIIFPCKINHSVDVVNCIDKFNNYRYSIQYFARFN